MIYTGILMRELLAAGITDIEGCSSDGDVWLADGTRVQSRPDVAAIVLAHQSNTYDVDEFGNERRLIVSYEGMTVIASDFQVKSRKIKIKPDEAMVEIDAEEAKGSGVPKSLDLISRSLIPVVRDLLSRLGVLEKKVK